MKAAGNRPAINNMERREDIRDEKAREIIMESALNGVWCTLPEEFHSGDVMGFDLAGISVRAAVTFDRYAVVVNMTSPAVCTGARSVFYRQQTFFRRNPPGASLFVGGIEDGPATQRCLETAKEVLIGLYTDWLVLWSRRDEIRSKLAGFAEWSEAFLEQERARIAPDKQKLLDLSARSGQLKRRFKRGEMSESEYVREKQPIHEEIVALMGKTGVRNPFMHRFRDEIWGCRFVRDRELLIQDIGNSQ